jgi:hypothetical protein
VRCPRQEGFWCSGKRAPYGREVSAVPESVPPMAGRFPLGIKDPNLIQDSRFKTQDLHRGFAIFFSHDTLHHLFENTGKIPKKYGVFPVAVDGIREVASCPIITTILPQRRRVVFLVLGKLIPNRKRFGSCS